MWLHHTHLDSPIESVCHQLQSGSYCTHGEGGSDAGDRCLAEEDAEEGAERSEDVEAGEGFEEPRGGQHPLASADRGALRR